MKKRILIYGDSNTWGSKAFGNRYDTEKQWPNIFQKLLGDRYEVIQEGLCGRIAGDHDKKDVHRNGRIGFEIIARSAAPIDYIVIALGTNDVKSKYALSSDEIVKDLEWIENRLIEFPKQDDDFNELRRTIYLGLSNFYESAPFKKEDAEIIHRIHKGLIEHGKNLIIPSNLEHSEDGLHYSEADHKKVANMVYRKFKDIEE
jgi:lysophospholipase L1-like esterase